MKQKKKFELSEEDKELFRNAVKDVKPISEDKHITPSQNTKLRIYKKILAQSLNDFRFMGEITLEKLSCDEWLTREDSIHFTQGEISRHTLKHLKNGQIQIDVKLDLHGYTGDEAISAMTQCILRSQESGKRVLLIIHGKSQIPGKHGPILKNIVHQWLKNRPEILAIQSAHPKHGGTGAVYVLLRRHTQQK